MTVHVPKMQWLDFSGAPPMLIPRSLAPYWRGTTDPSTGESLELSEMNPVTDYDHACNVAWPGQGVLEFKGTPILVLYSEYDLQSWDDSRWILACGGWFPSEDEVRLSTWTDPIRWRAKHADYFLMNSAADARKGLLEKDYMQVQLTPGSYTIECADITSEYVGIFHRFVRDVRVA